MDGPLFLVPSSGREWREWLRDDAIDLVIIVAVAGFALLVARKILSRVVRRVVRQAAVVRQQDPDLAERRTRTVASAISWLITIFIVFIGTALALDNLGLDVTALVASAGLAGLALTFGAQAMVRDLIAGTFILAENQYGVGDVVQIAGVSGEVIDVNPRRTVLRDEDGNVHTVPNGVITVTTNLTRGFSRINIDLAVPATADLDQVRELVDAEGRAFAAERAVDVISPPRVLRIQSVDAENVTLRVVGEVRPARQWELSGALHQRLRARLAEARRELDGQGSPSGH